MPVTQFTSLDFDQIKAQIKDYLAANSNFTDFDFEGSNFAILIDTLAYNTYINAFNANLVANESFLDSATLRENVVSTIHRCTCLSTLWLNGVLREVQTLWINI